VPSFKATRKNHLKHSSSKNGCGGPKPEDLRQVAVDKCAAAKTADISEVSIVLQDSESVTVAISQVWKGCNDNDPNGAVSWMAADFIGYDGDLECKKFASVDCGAAATITMQCQDGASVLDLYMYDDSTLFVQTDGSEINIPRACDASSDRSKMCHTRYIVRCAPTNCDDETPNVADVSSDVKTFWFF